MKKVLGLIVVFVFISVILIAQNQQGWRGDQRNGKYSSSGLLNEWPESGPEIVWHYDLLGEGFSSPSIADGKIYVSGMENTTGYIYCLSLNGELLWKSSYGEEFYESYPGARSTPVIAGSLIYIYSGKGALVCMNTEKGDIIWERDILNEFNGSNIRWGVTETLLVDGEKVYCTPGGKINNVVALNRFDGKLIWSSAGLSELSAYCSPLLIDFPQRKLFVTMTQNHIIGIDASTGKMLWSHEQKNRYSVHANTPLYHEGGLFCFSGYGQGGVKLKISNDGSSVEKEWFNSNFDSRMGGAVVVNGFIYGSGDNNREWRCIDWKTGEERYVDKTIGKGNVIYSDGKLYCYTERGELAIAEATPEQFKLLSKTKVSLGSSQHWAHPVIFQGKLFVRHGNSLIVYKI